MQYLRVLARGIENIEIRLFSKAEMAKREGRASFNGKFIKVTPDATLWELAHEMKHARDLEKYLKTPLGQLRVLNAIIGNNLNEFLDGTKLEWLGNWWYNAAKMEKDAYAVEAKVKEYYGYSRKVGRQISRKSSQGSGNFWRNGRTGFKIDLFTQTEDRKNVLEPTEEFTRRNTSSIMGENDSGKNGSRSKKTTERRTINQVIRDKVYDCHGN